MLTQEAIDAGKARARHAYSRWAGRMLARHGGGSPEYQAAHARAGKANAAPRYHDGPAVRVMGHDWHAIRVDETGAVVYALQHKPGCCPNPSAF